VDGVELDGDVSGEVTHRHRVELVDVVAQLAEELAGAATEPLSGDWQDEPPKAAGGEPWAVLEAKHVTDGCATPLAPAGPNGVPEPVELVVRERGTPAEVDEQQAEVPDSLEDPAAEVPSCTGNRHEDRDVRGATVQPVAEPLEGIRVL